MLANKTDLERTLAARKAKVFLDRRSRYTIAGHVFLKGKDASARREKVFADNIARGAKCDICGKWLFPDEGDLEHIEGGTKNARCWCYHQVLNDGTIHTNVRRSCSMFARGSCHARKHHRVLEWKTNERPG